MSTRTSGDRPGALHAGHGQLIAHAAAHGSLGELWQGPVVHEGVPRIGLVSLPVPRHSYASFYASGPGAPASVETLTAKRRATVEAYSRMHSVEMPPGRWDFTSDLPVGKGMSSSTADILALLRCLDTVFGLKEDPAATRAILNEIERSDAVHTDQYCLYLSGAHVIVKAYPSSVAFNVCYAYDDYEVPTDDFPEDRLLRIYEQSASEYADSLRQLDRALTRQDAVAVAREATRSAELAQAYLPSSLADDLLRDHRGLGGIGVIRAHTGTVVGLLSDTGFGAARRAELCGYFLARGYRCYFTRGGYPLV